VYATEMLIASFYRNDRRINERERFACERKMGRNNAGIAAHYRVIALRNRYLYRTRRGVVRRQDFGERAVGKSIVRRYLNRVSVAPRRRPHDVPKILIHLPCVHRSFDRRAGHLSRMTWRSNLSNLNVTLHVRIYRVLRFCCVYFLMSS